MTARAVAELPPCRSAPSGSDGGVSAAPERGSAFGSKTPVIKAQRHRRLMRAVLSVVMAGAMLVGATQLGGMMGGAAQAAQGCSLNRIDLRPAATSGQGARQSFAVEIADTAARRAQGLMYRRSLAPDAGMLFIYETPRRAEFWMKNTLIPLDIIFADPSGRVTAVHENAIPGDETPIPGGDNVLYVLEINGGLARKAGIVPGSEMRHPRITAAAWPCP